MLFSNITDEEPDEELQHRLNEILSQLPEKQKEVLLKHVVDHKTIPDIAKELNIAESSVKTITNELLPFFEKIYALYCSVFKIRKAHKTTSMALWA